MKKQKALNRLAAVAVVLLAFCLVFVMPVGAADDVATLNGHGYATLQAAVNAATEDAAITVTGVISTKPELIGYDKSKDATSGDGTTDNPYISPRVLTSLTITGGSIPGFSIQSSYRVNYDKSPAYYTVDKYDIGTLTFKDIKITDCVTIFEGKHTSCVNKIDNLVFDNVTFDMSGKTVDAAIHIISRHDSIGSITIKNCKFINVDTVKKSVGIDYRVESDVAITIENCEFIANSKGGSTTAFNAIQIGGTGSEYTGTIKITGNEITNTNDRGIRVGNFAGTITVTGNTLTNAVDSDGEAIKIGILSGASYTVESNTLNDESLASSVSGDAVVAKVAVAKINDTGYLTIADAVGAAGAGDTVTLLKDVMLTEPLEISKSVTIDGKKSDTENYKISTSESKNLIWVTNDGNSEIEVTIQNVNLESTYTGAARIINVVNDNIKLNLNNALLDASTTGTESNGTDYTQVLNCGHLNSQGSSYENVIFNLDTVKIEAPTGGYAIFSVNPFILDIKNSEISGYTALYFKTIGTLSAKGAQVTIADSTLTSTNPAEYDEDGKNQSAFGTMVFEATDISVTLESGTTLEAESSDGYCRQAIFHFNEKGYSDVSDGWYEIELIPGNTHVTVNNGVKLLTKGPNANIEQTGHGEDDPLTINDINKFMSFENGVITNTDTLSAFLGNEQILESTADSMYKVVAKTYELTATTTKVGFDSVKVGYTQPEPQPVTIKNAGNVPVTINKPTYENFDVIDFPANAEIEEGKELSFKIQPKAGLAVGNYGTTLEVTNTNNEKATFEVSFLVYQPSSGGSSKPVEEPEEPVVEPETPVEEPEAGEATVETEVTDGGEVELETPAAGGSAAADEDEAKITGVVLPTGTEGKVEFVPISEQAAPAGKETQTKKVFEINVPTYEKGKAAVIKFTMTVAELAADGKEAADVALWHFDEETGEWTKLVTSYTIVDGVVYFEAITNDFSPFAIIYEDEPVDEPVEEPETPASPAPVLGLIAALGAAVVLRRK